MYLHDAIISDDGERHDMAGVIHGECKNSGKLVRFGYAEFRLEEQMSIRGHEFHYYDSNACGTDCTAVKPVTGKSWSCGHFGKNHYWSYGHLYYPSNPAFVQWFVGECRQWAP